MSDVSFSLGLSFSLILLVAAQTLLSALVEMSLSWWMYLSIHAVRLVWNMRAHELYGFHPFAKKKVTVMIAMPASLIVISHVSCLVWGIDCTFKLLEL